MNLLETQDKFIHLQFKELKKSHIEESKYNSIKLKNDLGNRGGKVGSIYKVDRNGEYNGIQIQLEEPIRPLFLSNSVHQIYLNIETGYTSNIELIEKFSLYNLYQKYSNQLFRFIVDEFLIFNNLNPFYKDYHEITNMKTDEELNELKNKIKYDYNTLIPSKFKIVGCGNLLPESWLLKSFDNGKHFHEQIDKLDERIGKPPVTYLANYCMTLEKISIPQIVDLTWVKNNYKFNSNQIILLSDNKNLKFNKISPNSFDTHLIPNTNYSILNICLEKNVNIVLIFEPDLIMDKIDKPIKTSIGFNASLFQKSIRRGLNSKKCLIESIDNLTIALPFNNPEYSYQMVSGIRQLCWRSFITIIEETKCYYSSKYLDLFDFVLYSYIFSIYSNYYCSDNLKTQIKNTCVQLQNFKEYWDYNIWEKTHYNKTKRKSKQINPTNLETDLNKISRINLFVIGLNIGIEKMPGMKGDKHMLDITSKWLETLPILSDLPELDNLDNNFLNITEEKITWLNSIDHHSNPNLIPIIHNGLYGFDTNLINRYYKLNSDKITLEDVSGIIWELNSKYNFRKESQFNYTWINDLIILNQYLINKNKSHILNHPINLQEHKSNLDKLDVLSESYTSLSCYCLNQKLLFNLSHLEYEKNQWVGMFDNLESKFEYKQNQNQIPNNNDLIENCHIGQTILSNQIVNSFLFRGKKIIPIYTNEKIKFKQGDVIYDELYDNDDNDDNDTFSQILNYFVSNYKTHISIKSKILKTNEFDIKISNRKILINNIECVEIINKNELVWGNNLKQFLIPEPIYKTKIKSNSKMFKKILYIITNSQSQPSDNNFNLNPINKYIEYKSLELIPNKIKSKYKNYLIESDLLKFIPIEILKILIGRIGTSIEDQSDMIILILGKVDRMGKTMTFPIDNDNEGYLIRIMNVMTKFYSCFEKINETKFIIHTHSLIYKYWLEQINMIMHKKHFINNNLQSNIPFSTFIKTELWEHQKKVKNMILNGILKYKQKGWGDASNVGSGKTLTGLSVIDGINNIIRQKLSNSSNPTNYLILVPNTNLYGVWENEIKSHCDLTQINYYLQNSNGTWISNTSVSNHINLYISTMSRNRDNPLEIPIEFVIVDECLSVQNNQTKWTIKAFEQVVKSTFGVLMLSATFFRTRFDKLFFMLKMLQIELPTKINYLDTILNIAIGANIKSTNKQWEITIHSIKLNKEFYQGYSKSKKPNKKDSWVALTKYMRDNVNWEQIIIDKVNVLVGLGRKPVIFVESQTQLEKLKQLLNINYPNIKHLWSFYPDITQDICVISKHKGTYGINNLIKYDTLVLKPPEPDKLPQIKGRLDRPGQNSSKLFIEYIIIADTIDQIDLINLDLANNFYSSHIIPLANYYDKYV